MKRVFKIIALTMAVAALALSLCSCQYLDDLRSHQAFYADEEKSAIRFNDKLYKKYECTGNCSLIYKNKNSWSIDYTVTKEDVPVLLSREKGDWITLDRDESFIILNNYDGKAPVYYIREDQYDNLAGKLENAKLDHYYFNYSIYPENYYDPIATAIEKNILLDDELTATIDRALKTPREKRETCDSLSFTGNSDRIILTRCDKDMLVQDDSIDIHLILDGGKCYVWDSNTYDEQSFCPVTDKKEIQAVKALFNENKEAIFGENYHMFFDDRGYKGDYAGYDDPKEMY